MAWMLLKSWQDIKGTPNHGTPLGFVYFVFSGCFLRQVFCFIGLIIVFVYLPYLLKVCLWKKRNCFFQNARGTRTKKKCLWGSKSPFCENLFLFNLEVLSHPLAFRVQNPTRFPPTTFVNCWVMGNFSGRELIWKVYKLKLYKLWTYTRFDQIYVNVNTIIVVLPSEWIWGTVVVFLFCWFVFGFVF